MCVFSDICLSNVSAINSNSCHQSSLNTCASAPGSASLIAASAVFGECAAACILRFLFFVTCVHEWLCLAQLEHIYQIIPLFPFPTNTKYKIKTSVHCDNEPHTTPHGDIIRVKMTIKAPDNEWKHKIKEFWNHIRRKCRESDERNVASSIWLGWKHTQTETEVFVRHE